MLLGKCKYDNPEKRKSIHNQLYECPAIAGERPKSSTHVLTDENGARKKGRGWVPGMGRDMQADRQVARR